MVLAKRPHVLADPVKNLRETKFPAIHRAVNKLVPCLRIDFDVETVAPQEDVGGSEGDPLVAVEKAVVVAERLHQRGRFFFERVVIADLGTENGGLPEIASFRKFRQNTLRFAYLSHNDCMSGKRTIAGRDRRSRCSVNTFANRAGATSPNWNQTGSPTAFLLTSRFNSQ